MLGEFDYSKNGYCGDQGSISVRIGDPRLKCLQIFHKYFPPKILGEFQ